MRYDVNYSSRYDRDLKRVAKRRKNLELLDEIVDMLAEGKPLPEKNHDHALTGNWKGFRECHIEPDRLPVYRREDDKLILVLMRTGSHSDLGF